MPGVYDLASDGLSKRQRLDRLLSQLKQERDSWRSHWVDLADYIIPRRQRFLTTDRNRGEKRNSKIIDSTATFAVRTLQSGMMSGITSPARPWFRLTLPDKDLAEYAPVKRWLYEAETRMRDLFLRSNLYNVLPLLYGDIGVYGTGAMAVLEDDEDIIRCYPFPIGSYYLAANERGQVDTFGHEYSMTVRQLVARFGLDNVSVQVKQMWENRKTEEWVDVVHVVAPNEEHDPDKLESKYKRFKSCYYEVGGQRENDNQLLGEMGFEEFPILAPRWGTNGEDIYGYSPGMDALGDIRALQILQTRKYQAIEKMVNPPLMAPASLKQTTVSLLPGGITYHSERESGQGLRPLYEVNPRVQEVMLDVADHQNRIRRAFYEDLFLMLAQSDRRQITAREIDERHEEKLLALGPVLERLNDELLDPLIDRTFAIMERRELLPKPPEEIAGADLKVEYVSIMAQAQRMLGLAGVDRLLSLGAQIAQVQPEVVDKFDLDQVVDEYADMLGVSPRLVRSDDEVAAIRATRQQQAAAQQQLAAVESATKSAKTLSETTTEGDNALTRLLRLNQVPGAA